MKGNVQDDYTARLALTETYDQAYGIFDHDVFGSMDPLAIIGMHPSEDVITGSRLELVTREVIALRLPELTNTPLLELLSYPRWFLEKLVKDGRRAREAEDNATQNLQAPSAT